MAGSVLDRKKILAVDDEPDVLVVLKEEIRFNCAGCVVDTAGSYEEALKCLRTADYDLIVLDIMGVRGFDLLEVAAKKKVRAVMLTAHALTPENLERSYQMGARAYLPKNTLGEIVPFLEDVLTYDFQTGWGRVLVALRDTFSVLWGRDWEKWEKLIEGKKLPSFSEH